MQLLLGPEPVLFGATALIAAGGPVRVSQRLNFLLCRRVCGRNRFDHRGRGCRRRFGCGRARLARRYCGPAASRRGGGRRHHYIGLGLASFCHRIILPKLWRMPYQFFLSVRSQVCFNIQIRCVGRLDNVLIAREFCPVFFGAAAAHALLRALLRAALTLSGNLADRPSVYLALAESLHCTGIHSREVAKK